MKKVAIYALAAVFAVGCGTKQNNVPTEEMGVDKALEQAEQFVGKNITVIGTVGHVCGHGGGKLFLTNDDNTKRLKVEPSSNLQSFSPEMEGLVYKISGSLEEMRIDEEYLNNWEKELAEEAHEGEGHNQGQHAEKADMGEHTDAKSKIEAYRAQIASSGKGYVAIYTLKAIKLEKVEKTESEEAKVEEPKAEEKTPEAGQQN
ncbi:MAG TPA: hypothetical protein PK990_07580 [Salinivirgaceae bacterium]|nr:hypothetical protein [Salinivirgaceae bacterium]